MFGQIPENYTSLTKISHLIIIDVFINVDTAQNQV